MTICCYVPPWLQDICTFSTNAPYYGHDFAPLCWKVFSHVGPGCFLFSTYCTVAATWSAPVFPFRYFSRLIPISIPGHNLEWEVASSSISIKAHLIKYSQWPWIYPLSVAHFVLYSNPKLSLTLSPMSREIYWRVGWHRRCKMQNMAAVYHISNLSQYFQSGSPPTSTSSPASKLWHCISYFFTFSKLPTLSWYQKIYKAWKCFGNIKIPNSIYQTRQGSMKQSPCRNSKKLCGDIAETNFPHYIWCTDQHRHCLPTYCCHTYSSSHVCCIHTKWQHLSPRKQEHRVRVDLPLNM